MKKLISGLVFLSILAVAGLLAAPNFIPASVYKPRIEQAANEALGREVIMAGDVSLSLFPKIEVMVGDVTIANVAGGTAPHLAKMEQLSIGVEVMPLLSGVVEVESFTLQKPDINLEVDRQGRANWDFTQGASASSASEDQPEASGSFSVENITFGDVTLQQGRVSYRTPAGVEVYENINAKVDMPTLESPLALVGDLTYQKTPLDVVLNAGNPKAFWAGGESDLSVKLDSSLLSGSFLGDVTLKQGGAFNALGKADIDVTSVANVMKLLTGSGKGYETYKKLTFTSGVNATDKTASLSGLDLTLNGMTASGSLDVNYAGAKPVLTGALSMDHLNFNALTGYKPAKSTGGNGGQGSAAPAQSEWSKEKLDLSALKTFNADLDLSVNRLTFQELNFGKSDLGVKLRGGVLTAALNEVNLYKGAGSGTLKLDARTPTTKITSDFTLDKIATLPFLSDAMGLDRLEGIGAFNYSISTSGKSQRQLMRNMSGTSGLTVIDGALKGVNLASMARTYQQLIGKPISNAAGQESVGLGEKTDFAEFLGSFNIKNGVIQTKDLRLSNPFIRLSGSGNINLVQQKVKLRLLTKIVDSGVGQGGDMDLSGVTIPILVDGSWDNIKYGPDVAGLVGSAIGVENVEKPEDLLKGVLEGLLTPKKKDAAPKEEPQKEEKPDPAKLLLDLLGGNKSP